jgi:hypothetical protein
MRSVRKERVHCIPLSTYIISGKEHEIVIYEPSARPHFLRMSALLERRATKERVLHLC